jgi:hypothetical protein
MIMSLKDRLGSLLHKKSAAAPAPAAESFEGLPDFYSGVKKTDEDLFEAAIRLKSLADDILAESARRPPDPTASVEKITVSCSKTATDWINSEYKIHEFLAEAYGKSWADPPVAKEMLVSVCQASSISDRQTAASLEEGVRLIAIAGAAMLIHGLFTMARNPDSETATRNAVATASTAKTYILGL